MMINKRSDSAYMLTQNKEAVKDLEIVWALRLTDPGSHSGPTKYRGSVMK